MKQTTDTSAFLHGSLLLTLSALTAKVCGALFRIPLTSLLGGRGMGYFSTAYGLFLPLYAVLVTGLSTAVAKPVADRCGRGDFAGARRIRRAASLLFLGTGLLGTAAALLCAKAFTLSSAGDLQAYPAVLVMAPAIVICSLTAVERGYREGLCDMLPTAVSQGVEALARLVLGLTLCQAFLTHPPALLQGCTPESAGACGAVLGVTLSALAGWGCTLLGTLGERPVKSAPKAPLKPILRDILRLLIPASLGALVTNLTSLIDLVTVMRLLPDGSDPAFQYGSFMGMAVTVFGLVPSLTNMLAKGVLPCTAQAWARGDRPAAAVYARQVLSLTGLLCIPAGCGLFALSRESLTFLFAGRSAEIGAAWQSLRALSPAVICLCLTYPLFSLLQAIGQERLPVLLMLPGLLVKCAGNLLLVPRLGITGAALSTSLCYAVILVPALIVLRRTLGAPLHLAGVLLPQGFAGVLCGAAAYVCFGMMQGFPQRIAFFLAVLAGGAVYALALWLLTGHSVPAMLRPDGDL